MILKELHFVNFRNYTDFSFRLSPGVNCFTGPNGSGKTNILDAIHYLSLCKSFSNSMDAQNIRFGEEFLVIEGRFESDGQEDLIYCGIKRGQKKQFLRNKAEYERLADHIGLLPLVLIAPQDSELLSGGAEERRKFLDAVIAQFDRRYLDDLILYNRVLSQRNALLKSMKGKPGEDKGMLEVMNKQMAEPGIRIFQKRSDFVKEFQPIFSDAYAFISDGKEEASVAYTSHLQEGSFPELLLGAEERDIALQHTCIGIHRDDLEMSINGRSARKYASQGQQKSLLIALRIAQYRFMHRRTGKKPLLLLDDISAKLDEMRVRKLMQLVNERMFGQIFLTDTDPERVRSLFASASGYLALFRVEDGSIILHEHVGA